MLGQDFFENMWDIMKKGDVVKFKKPADEAESTEQFKLLEDPDGGRVLVQGYVPGWTIQPTKILNVFDLECVDCQNWE